MAQPIQQALQMGYKFESKVLDLENVDVSHVLIYLWLQTNCKSVSNQ